MVVHTAPCKAGAQCIAQLLRAHGYPSRIARRGQTYRVHGPWPGPNPALRLLLGI